jgi:hypothetical protein
MPLPKEIPEVAEYVKVTKKFEATTAIEAELATLKPEDKRVSELGRSLINSELVREHVKSCRDNIVSMKLQYADLGSYEKSMFTLKDQQSIQALIAICDKFVDDVKPYLE